MEFKGIIKRQAVVIAVIVICLTIAIIGGAYAIFSDSFENTNDQVIETGKLSVNFGTSGTTLTTEMTPMTEADALRETGYTFTITNNGSLPGNYYVALYRDTVNAGDTHTDHSNIMVSVDGAAGVLLSEIAHTSATATETNQALIHYQIKSGVIQAGSGVAPVSHTVRLWIKDGADPEISGEAVKLKIEVVAVVNK